MGHRGVEVLVEWVATRMCSTRAWRSLGSNHRKWWGVSIRDEEPNGGKADGGIDVDMGKGEIEGIVDVRDGKDRRVEEDAAMDSR